MRVERLLPLGIGLIFIGFIMVIVGTFSSANTSTGIVIFIGPIPLIFDSGPYGSQLALISLVASIAIMLFVFLWAYRRSVLL